MKNYAWMSGIAVTASCVCAFAATPRSLDYAKAPLTFEANAGQTDGQVKYLSRGPGYTLFLTGDNQAVLSLSRKTSKGERHTAAVRMSMMGSRNAVSVRALEPHATVSNYLQGSDSRQWLSGVRHFGRVVYEGVYPGIDAVYYGNQRQLEYDFVVAPGANPQAIRLKFEGAEKITKDSNGDLVLHTDHGEVRQLKPVVYQDINGRRQLVTANYALQGNEATFSIGDYDRSRKLVIDPVLVYSGFLGGTGLEYGSAIALDTAGNIYVAGSTSSSNFPILGAIPGRSNYAGGADDAFVVKYSATGNTILSSTFIGGAGSDSATGVGVDTNGNILVAGQTDSTNFPLRSALQTVLGGKRDAFLLKLTPANALVYSTYIGGFEDDLTLDLAVDAGNNAVVCGRTSSTNFWASGGLRAAFMGGLTDGWLFKMNPDGQRVWSTYLGGNGNDSVNAIAVDPAGHVYATGYTSSLSFPATAGVFQRVISHPSQADAFVTKIAADGKSFLYSTYLGGTNADEGIGIAVNAAGNAFVTGDTSSGNFPVLGPLQGPPGNGDTFVTKLNTDGTGLVFSTYLAGSNIDNAADIGIDAADNVYVAGSTMSTNFPTGQPMQAAVAGGLDLYVTKIDASGSARVWSTYLGGSGDDVAAGMAVDPIGSVYLTGSTTSINYPRFNTLTALSGGRDAFLTKILGCDITLTPAGATFASGANSGSFVVNASNCPWTAIANDSWITITGASSGVNGGTISYNIAGNAGAARTGTISVAGVLYTITQSGQMSVTPSVVSVSPNAGSGMAQTLVGRFATANPGGAPIDRTYFLMNTTVNGTGSCLVEYTPSTNAFRLIQDNGAVWSSSAVGGTGATLSNSQCTLNLSGSTGTTAAGTGVMETVVNYALSFTNSFSGPRNTYLLAASEALALNSGWVQTGTWTVGSGPVGGTVGVQSFVPTTGSGTFGTFTATFTHTGGANAHYLGYMLFLPTPNVVSYTATGTCLIEYNRISNGLRLIDNAGTGWLGPLEGYPLGTNITLANSYCSVNVQNVVANLNGNTMTVTVPVVFTNSLGPVLGTFLQAQDVNGNWTGMTQFGNWVLPGAPPVRLGPTVGSITPQTATGSTVTYTLTSSHPTGWTSLSLINLLITDRIVGSPVCHVVYFPGNDTLNLVNDSTGLVSPTGITPGTIGALANSRCSVNTVGTVITKAGPTLSVTVPVTFFPSAFAGAKNVYGNAFDNAGLTSHWVQGALLTVQ